MANDRDLFHEEQEMVAMSFGDHIEDLRKHLIRALFGLVIGVILTFIPPLDLGKRVMKKMQDPAQQALDEFYTDEGRQAVQGRRQGRAKVADDHRHGLGGLRRAAPLDRPGPEAALDRSRSKARRSPLKAQALTSEQILNVASLIEQKNALISLAPMETMTIFFTVCMVTGLVLSSPWVFYQIWAFVAAGLFRHERHYVTQYLPYSLGLFLAGVASASSRSCR